MLAPYIALGLSSVLVDISCYSETRNIKKCQEECKAMKQSLVDLRVPGRIQQSSSQVPYSEKMGVTLELQVKLR